MIKISSQHVALAVCFLALCSSASAFETVRSGRPAAVPEHGSDKLAAQQAFNGTVPPVADNPNVGGITSADVKKADEKQRLDALLNTGAAKGAQVLQTAEIQKQEAAWNPIRTGIWALLVMALGVGIVYALRMWADKAIPAMPAKRQVRW